ncbi:YkvA family protein [Elizabethkingia sp. JS20170427COW]|uniref:YkvA family protein n=1 Tax=Elizabethkingia sp. JS20170427COW TaxID=2583851 RepID=UPI001110CDAE|nr:DUF1232 domain-containing protein [Elizabethkingia sp. JS20170427COW]QCX53460.1 DUF1232 domain-containing protein [Elizabethkingia sp. JS20170427COW]
MAKKSEIIKEVFRHKGLIQKLPDVYRMLKAIANRSYKPEIKGFILPAFALLYAISPIDVIPDWIPLVGAMDDLAVLAIAIPALMKEVEKFLIWEEEQKNKTLIEE